MDKKKMAFGFSINKIISDQFAALPDVYVEGSDVDLSTNLAFRLDDNGHALTINVGCRFEQGHRTFLLISVSTTFEINVKTKDLWKDQEDVVVSKAFIRHLTLLSIGIARGVLHTKTENTVFNKFILPPLDLNTLVPEDIRFTMTMSLAS